MPKNTFLLGANLARTLCVALALVLIVACKPDSLSGRKTASQGTDQSALPIAAPQPASSVMALIDFWPDPALPIDRATGFDFGARIIFDTLIDSIAHIAAFALRPGETPSDCQTPQVPSDRPFWAEEKNFAPGQHYYSRSFFYDDVSETDRLVIRASVIDAGPGGQVLYCEQKIYPLTTSLESTPMVSSETQLALNPAQVIEGRDYAVSGSVVVTVSTPHATRVEFFTAPLDTGVMPRLEYTDVDGHDGWVWHWSVPASGFAGRVWADAVQPDGSRTSSPVLTAMTLDVWGVTPLPTLAPIPPPPGPSAIWSPDGRYFATTDIYGGIVGEANSQHVFTASMASGVEAWRWTNDSRFVIFRWRHPHNNSYTYVFDAHAWKLIWSTNGCKFTGRADLLGWENCGDYPVALSPNAPRFLLMNGKLIELPDWRQVELLPDFPVGQVSVLGESSHGDLSAWSPDGSALAFVVQLSFDPAGFALYSARGDGAQVRQVTSLANYPKSLQWSSDSKQVIVTTGPFDSDVSDLRYVLDIATGQVEVERITALTPTPPPLPTPTLATPPATPTPPSDRDFYTLQRLTTTVGGAYRPAVSPDGQRVAYASERNGNWDIYVLDPTTNVETRLTDDPLNDMAPSWSPDGARIAYQHNVPSASGPVFVDQIVMNADGLNKIVVSSGAVWNGNDPPAWSPAGDRIAFADRGEVVVVSVADQREVTRFKPTPGWAYADPIWIDQPFIAFTNNGTPVVGDTRDGTVGGVYYDTPGLYGVPVENAAWSPDGRFIAIQSGAVVHVVNGETPSAALFTIDTRTPPSDLLSVSWLPDSSGLVVVAAIDGQPDLYLVRLNLPAIEDFWSIAPIAAATPVSGLQPPPTSPPMPTPFPTPANRWETPAAWRAVVDDQHIVEWRVYADNEPLRQLMANAPSDHRYWGSRP